MAHVQAHSVFWRKAVTAGDAPRRLQEGALAEKQVDKKKENVSLVMILLVVLLVLLALVLVLLLVVVLLVLV